jgi:hypothetical protein
MTIALNEAFEGTVVTFPLGFDSRTTIILSQPLHELWAHVKHCQLPSWSLLARAIYTLFMAIFTWHFCDGILLLRNEGLYHSFNGHTEVISATGRRQGNRGEGGWDMPLTWPHLTPEDLAAFETRFPHLLESARRLQTNAQLPYHADHHHHVQRTIILNPGAVSMEIPDLTGYPEISAQRVRRYFLTAYGKEITDRAENNTLATLVYSDRLRPTEVLMPRHSPWGRLENLIAALRA